MQCKRARHTRLSYWRTAHWTVNDVCTKTRSVRPRRYYTRCARNQNRVKRFLFSCQLLCLVLAFVASPQVCDMNKWFYYERWLPACTLSNILCQQVRSNVFTERPTIFKCIWIKCLLETNLTIFPEYIACPTRVTPSYHSSKFINIGSSSNTYKYNFFSRTLKEWNSLPLFN